MAQEKQNNREKERMHCGFEAPVIGTVLPKGTTWINNPDGTITPILPVDADKEAAETADEINAARRFADQPGQWIDTTPEDVKQRQAEELRQLRIDMMYSEPSNYIPEEIRQQFFPETVNRK